jgi:hypothetical protein
MESLNLSESKTKKITFSEFGERLEAGEPTFEVDFHGRRATLSLSEYETKFLGLREFSTASRKKLAKSGAAMSDGSFPIANCQDAKNARQAIGRAPAGKRAAVKAHIAKREKALGCSNK